MSDLSNFDGRQVEFDVRQATLKFTPILMETINIT